MQRFNARWLGLAAITLIALYLCWLIILPFVDVILWAAVLAVIVYPYHLWLRKRGFGRNTAALISTLGVILVVMLPVAVVMASLATQIPTTDQINDNFIKLQNLITPDNWLYRKINPYFDLERFKDLTWIKERLSDYAGAMAKRSVAVASDIAVVIINICFALFTLFYLLRDNHKIGIAVTNVLPLDDQQAQDVFHRCEEIIRASVQGVIFIAAIQGAMGGLAFWVLGVKPALLWGVVMFVMSMIPALGAFIVWVPAAIYLLATGQYWQGAALALWGGLAIGSIDNFLRPRLVGQKTGMHDLVIFFSVLGGLQVFGILGLFVGPVVVAVALSIVEVFREATGTGKSTGDRVVVVEAATVIMPPTETSRPAETMALPDAPR